MKPIGFIWLRKGSIGRLLWMRQSTSRFHKMQGFSWLGEELLASQEALCIVILTQN